MDTLYIHGLDSAPIPEKVSILESYKHSVSALHINYREENNVYEQLKNLAVTDKVQFIVGSSLGGLLGYWLSHELKLPCLLFNPAIHYNANFGWTIPINITKASPLQLIVIGEQDDIVDPDISWKYFKEEKKNGAKQKVIKCQWLSHQIDLETFEEITNWATFNVQKYYSGKK